jgi:hypothetical protein
MKLAGHVAYTKENRNAYRFVMAKIRRKRPLERLKSKRMVGWWRYRLERYGMD